MDLNKNDYISQIKKALDEDLSNIGDITSDPIFGKETSVFILMSKDNGILCGTDIFRDTMLQTDKNCKIEFYFEDGNSIVKDDIIAKITGLAKNILTSERTALNFLSHLSGIATKTSLLVKETKGKAKILDTRKTIPGLRKLQKYAVACGGGHNHRMGLYDMVLIKDNHIDASGSITNAVKKVKNKWKNKYKIEVETRNLEEVKEALSCNIDRIMLDNMKINEIKKAVKLINKKAEIEVSGNITKKRIRKLSGLGIDYISLGSLTHSADAFDFSLQK